MSDIDVGRQVESLIREDVLNSGIIIALCLGWPESESVARLPDILAESRIGLLTPARIAISCLVSATTEIEKVISGILNTCTGDPWEFLFHCREQLLRRIRRDDALYDRLNHRLCSAPTPGEKASLPKLLGAARGVDPALLRQWCAENYERQMAGRSLPELGPDLYAGRIRPVAHALLDVLAPIGQADSFP